MSIGCSYAIGDVWRRLVLLDPTTLREKTRQSRLLRVSLISGCWRHHHRMGLSRERKVWRIAAMIRSTATVGLHGGRSKRVCGIAARKKPQPGNWQPLKQETLINRLGLD